MMLIAQQNIDLNANLAKCMKTATHWGYDKVYNVCNGNVTDVPWGFMDYMLGLGSVSIGLLMLVLVFRMIMDW